MTEIVLLAPPSRSDCHYRPPLALLYLGGFLTQRGVSVKIIDKPITAVRNKRFWKERDSIILDTKLNMIKELVDLDPKFVGISCYSTEYEEVIQLIADIRKVSKSKIIVGGIHPTLDPDSFKGMADHIVVGYGETLLYQIVTGKDPGTKIPMFSPDYSLVDMNYYTQANPYAIRGCFLRSAYILTSRGCPCQCSFCAAPRMRKYFGTLQRDVNSTILEICKLMKTNRIDGVYFMDDLFGINKDFLLGICKDLKDFKKFLVWGCSSKVSYLDEECIKAMSESGCVQIDFGVERGSQAELDKLKKGITIRQVIDTFDYCRKYKVRTFANFLVGLPWDDVWDCRDIVQLIERIKPTIVSINPFKAYYGTEIAQRGLKECTPPALFKWIAKIQKKYNKTWEVFKFHLTYRYFYLTLGNHWHYIKQSGRLLMEYINQKW